MNRPIEIRGVTSGFKPWAVVQDWKTRAEAVAFLQEEVDRGRKLHCCWIVENGVEVETFMVMRTTLLRVLPPRLRGVAQ